MSEPGYVAETLAWCNARRREQGKKPLERLPKGKRADSRSCPCGKATGMEVQERVFYYLQPDGRLDWRRPRMLPRAVHRFVVAFDNGRLPQYEAKR